jgi:hypothetical protein
MMRKRLAQKRDEKRARKLFVVEQQAFKPSSSSNIYRFGYR